MGPIQTVHELFSWLRRRWQTVVAVAVLGVIGGLVMAMQTERVYSASAVIQVINPVVAVSDGAAGVETPDITRRVQFIEQRLMSRDALLELAARHGLFEGMPISATERVALMRQTLSISAIAAAQQGFSRDGSLSALIVSASNDRAETAAAIANDLAQSLLRMSVDDRQSQARQAVEFFRAEEARLDAAIAALESEITRYQSENEPVLPAAVAMAREERGRLSESLLAIQQEISARETELASLDRGSARALTQRRIAQLSDEIGQFDQQARVLTARMAEIQDVLQRAPVAQQQLLALERRMEQLQEQLTSAAERRREAELGARIEVDQQSERFELLEAALVPEYPVSRSRKTVALLGAIAGVLGGLALAYALEWLNPVMRTAQRMERDLGLRPAISIPSVAAPAERRRRRMIWAFGLATLAAGAVALAVATGLV